MLAIIGKLDPLPNYREIRAGLDTTLRFLIFVLLLHALSVAGCGLHRLIANTFAYSVDHIAFDVLAHVLVCLVTDGSIADGAGRTGPSRLIVFDLFNHLIILRVDVATTTVVTNFNLG